MRELSSIKAAVFDLDGTLLDSSRIWEDLGGRFLLSIGVTPETELPVILGSMSLEEGCSYLSGHYRLRQTPEQVRTALLDILSDFYRSECELKSGAFQLLTKLKECGIPAVIATAGDRELSAAAMKRLDILDMFCGMVTCRECGGKDKPDIFLTAAKLAGSTPEHTAVFEDSLMAVSTAKAAGFLTAAVSDISEPQQDELKRTADYYCSSLSDYLRFFSVQASEQSASARISPSNSPV